MIRPEADGDIDAVRRVLTAAFRAEGKVRYAPAFAALG